MELTEPFTDLQKDRSAQSSHPGPGHEEELSSEVRSQSSEHAWNPAAKSLPCFPFSSHGGQTTFRREPLCKARHSLLGRRLQEADRKSLRFTQNVSLPHGLVHHILLNIHPRAALGTAAGGGTVADFRGCQTSFRVSIFLPGGDVYSKEHLRPWMLNSPLLHLLTSALLCFVLSGPFSKQQHGWKERACWRRGGSHIWVVADRTNQSPTTQPGVQVQ